MSYRLAHRFLFHPYTALFVCVFVSTVENAHSIVIELALDNTTRAKGTTTLPAMTAPIQEVEFLVTVLILAL